MLSRFLPVPIPMLSESTIYYNSSVPIISLCVNNKWLIIWIISVYFEIRVYFFGVTDRYSFVQVVHAIWNGMVFIEFALFKNIGALYNLITIVITGQIHAIEEVVEYNVAAVEQRVVVGPQKEAFFVLEKLLQGVE